LIFERTISVIGKSPTSARTCYIVQSGNMKSVRPAAGSYYCGKHNTFYLAKCNECNKKNRYCVPCGQYFKESNRHFHTPCESETISKYSSTGKEKSDIKPLTRRYSSTAATTGNQPNPLLTLGDIAAKRKKIPAPDMDVLRNASEKHPLPTTDQDDQGEDETENLQKVSTNSDSDCSNDSPSPASQATPNSSQSSLDIALEQNGSTTCLTPPQILRRSGAVVLSTSTGGRRVLASRDASENTVNKQGLPFGLRLSDPMDYGTMVTTITMQHSSTISQVKYHSATCSTSLKAIRCSCPLKDHSCAGALQWSSLPATDPQTNGSLHSVRKKGSSKKRSGTNLKEGSQK